MDCSNRHPCAPTNDDQLNPRRVWPKERSGRSTNTAATSGYPALCRWGRRARHRRCAVSGWRTAMTLCPQSSVRDPGRQSAGFLSNLIRGRPQRTKWGVFRDPRLRVVLRQDRESLENHQPRVPHAKFDGHHRLLAVPRAMLESQPGSWGLPQCASQPRGGANPSNTGGTLWSDVSRDVVGLQGAVRLARTNWRGVAEKSTVKRFHQRLSELACRPRVVPQPTAPTRSPMSNRRRIFRVFQQTPGNGERFGLNGFFRENPCT